jgi:hypothetical protein
MSAKRHSPARSPAPAGPSTGSLQRVRDVAAQGVSGSGAALPHLGAIQRSFGSGHDLSAVRTHSDGVATAAAQRVGAAAYTYGDRIAFTGTPSLHMAAHEAAHAIQQRAGISVPGGVGRPGDAHERQADAIADRVVQGRSSADLLAARAASPASPAVQMAPQATHFGRMIDQRYVETTHGADITIAFEPNDEVNATKIGMLQSVKTVASNKTILTDPTEERRSVPSGPGQGYVVDRVSSRNDPIYGTNSLAPGQGLADSDAAGSTHEIGYHYTEGATPKTKNAWMHDKPQYGDFKNSGMTFETTALALEGAQQGTYYGSVKWGWERDNAGTLKKIDFTAVSQGTPTQNFLVPAKKWNSGATRGTLVTAKAPTQVYNFKNGKFVPVYTVAKDTEVTSSTARSGPDVVYLDVTFTNGSHAGKDSLIKEPDLTDKGDGGALTALPETTVYVVAQVGGVKLNDFAKGPWRDWDTLPTGTRVQPTGKTTTADQWGAPKPAPGQPPTVLKWIKVVDGPLTGKGGYVPESALVKEGV